MQLCGEGQMDFLQAAKSVADTESATRAVGRSAASIRTDEMAWDERYQSELLRRLRGRLTRPEKPKAENLLRGLEPEIERIIAAHSHLVIDERTRPHLRLTAAVLVSYRALASGGLQPQESIELIEDVFAGIGRRALRLYTHALLAFSNDPFTAITRAGKQRALEQYGRAWEFCIEETGRTFSMTATKCFYADFFRAVGVPGLTRVFCAWDQNWIEPIDPAKHQMSFERPITIGHGGTECPFIFRRMAASE